MSVKKSNKAPNVTLQKPTANIDIIGTTSSNRIIEDNNIIDDTSPSDMERLKLMLDEEYSLQIKSINETHKQQTEKLLERINDKTKEIEQLCVLIEAVKPTPGMDPEKYLKILDEGNNSSEMDFRDTKIVELAKKCRRLQVALNKERSNELTNHNQIKELTIMNNNLKKEIEALVLKCKQEGKQIDSELPTDHDVKERLQRDLAISQKQVDELRKKLLNSQEESRKQQRIIQKEVGEGITTEQAVDDGWKGRAQQIIMLKAKVKRLENDSSNSESSGISKPRRRQDVDMKAEQELMEMQEEKQKILDNLQSEKAQLFEETSRLRDKVEAGKARIFTLTGETQRLKENIKVLIDKTESDDELIEALRQEIISLKKYVSRLSDKRDREEKDNNTTRIEFVNPVETNLNSAQDAELRRLRRTCAQQSEQLHTLDEIIRKLKQNK